MSDAWVWDAQALGALPACAALVPVIERLRAGGFPDLDRLSALAAERGIVSGGGAPLRFVPAQAASARDYETQIYLHGLVRTRSANWHDLFNALVWISFPLAKAQINRQHYRELQRRGTGGSRGTPRDVLTLFDEGGMIVACAEPELGALLRARAWKDLFWLQRDALRKSMRFYAFGHALCEKALRPYKGMTAKALIVDVDARAFDCPLPVQVSELDVRLAEHFGASGTLRATSAYPPLPVLGIPDWTGDNARAEYYDDAQHFRPAR